MIFGGGHDNTTNDHTDPSHDEPVFDVSAIPTEHLTKVLLEQELAQRRHHADLLATVAATDTRHCIRGATHRNLTLWLADHLHTSKTEAGRTVKLARVAFTEHPELGAAYRAGRLNEQHLRRFVHLWNRKELREALERDLDGLIRWTNRPWAQFNNLTKAWEEYVDPTDPNDVAAKEHNNRGFSFGRVGHHVAAQLDTTTIIFATLETALQAKVDQLFTTDWATAQARLGDDACMEDLDRNDTQRWHDALIALLQQGIGADPVTRNIDVNIVADHQTLQEEAAARDAQAAGHQRPPRSTEDAVERAETRRCESASGMPISPGDALDFTIAGRLRLYMINAETGAVTHTNRARLFKGADRLAVQLRDRYCRGAGCDTAAWRCEVDHDTRHTDGGKTESTNGICRCPACHRHKTKMELLGLWPPTALPAS